MHIIRGGVIVVLAGVVGAACSSGGGTDAKALTKPQYLARADAVCVDYHGRAQRLTATLPKGATEPVVAAFVTGRLLPLFRSQLDALRALPVPTADRTQVHKFLDDDATAASEIARDPNAFLRNGATTAALGRADLEMQHYGLNVCGASSRPAG